MTTVVCVRFWLDEPCTQDDRYHQSTAWQLFDLSRLHYVFCLFSINLKCEFTKMLSARDFYARAWTSRLDIYRRYSLQEESDSEQSDGSRSRKVKKYANQSDVREPPNKCVSDLLRPLQCCLINVLFPLFSMLDKWRIAIGSLGQWEWFPVPVARLSSKNTQNEQAQQYDDAGQWRCQGVSLQSQRLCLGHYLQRLRIQRKTPANEIWSVASVDLEICRWISVRDCSVDWLIVWCSVEFVFRSIEPSIDWLTD